ncbi:MAG: hypothetical protein ACOCWQ_03975 [Nanoarchaeota archaeon]
MPEEEQDQLVEEDTLESAEGRNQSLDSGSIEPREAAFMEGYDSDEGDEEDDYGLDEDEKMED